MVTSEESKSSASSASCLYSAGTELCADSVEFHPSLPGFFALGTYQVDQHQQSGNDDDDDNDGEEQGDDQDGDEEEMEKKASYTRRGRLTFHQVVPPCSSNAPDGMGPTWQVDTVQSFETAAILDMKWTTATLSLPRPSSPASGPSSSKSGDHAGADDASARNDGDGDGTLALADALGSIHFYTVASSPSPPSAYSAPSPSSSSAQQDNSANATTSTTSKDSEQRPRRQSERLRIQHAAQIRLNPTGALCLSLDFSDGRRPGRGRGGGRQDAEEGQGAPVSLVVSQSDGTLVYVPRLGGTAGQGFGDGSDGGQEELEEQEDGEEEELDEDDPLWPYYHHRDDSNSTDTSPSPSTSTPRQPVPIWDGRPEGMQVWRAHAHEAWIAAWDCWSAGRVLWSGGDDCTMSGWDVRTPIRGPQRMRQATFTVRRGFEGGVTSMQSSHLREHLWAVGSYDGHFRLFDARRPARPLQSLDVGGGIWRTKWHPRDPGRVLLGCMHAGFKVVRVGLDLEGEGGGDGGEGVEVVWTFEGHASLAYGCDWERAGLGLGLSRVGVDSAPANGEERGDTLVGSCSFYDARLCLWTA